MVKMMFLSKWLGYDLQTVTAFLCTCVHAPDTDNTKNLQQLPKYLSQIVFLPLIITLDGTKNLYWSVNASFAVHCEMKGHNRVLLIMEKGSLISLSTNQKINARNLIKSKIIAWGDSIPYVLWMHLFVEG